MDRNNDFIDIHCQLQMGTIICLRHAFEYFCTAYELLFESTVNFQAGLYGMMMTSSNGTFSALLALCAGSSAVTGEFPAQRPVTRSFNVFFDLRLNKRLSKQS